MKKAIDILLKVQVFIGSLALTIFLVTVVIQMLTRYMGISALWTEDVSMYSFIWAVFMGASCMVRENKHFAFTAFADKIKNPRSKAVLNMVIHLLMLIFNITLVIYGSMLMIKFWNYKWVSIPAFNRGPTWLCLPVSGVTSAIYLLERLAGDIKALKGGNE